jgi:hypothetical protein
MPGRLRHVVLFKLPDDHDPSLADELATDARALLAAGGQPGRVARDLGFRPGHPRSAEVLLEAVFDDRPAFDAYLTSEAHLAFLARWLEREGVGIIALQAPEEA